MSTSTPQQRPATRTQAEHAPPPLSESQVKEAYRRWAPIYDQTFGRVASEGRRQVVEIINRRPGRVLEVGVGTGLSLPMYSRANRIVGIDLSREMLDKARKRVSDLGLDNVEGLHEVDAAALPFADESFDTVVAMYVMTVVPDPEKVMQELSRVTRPGGEVLLVNHFSEDAGVRGWVERRMAPFGSRLGWRPVFELKRVMGVPSLTLIERRSLRPLGLFTLLRFSKQDHPRRA